MINVASPNSTSHLSIFEPNQVQPNAVDICVDQIFTARGMFVLTEDYKHHRPEREEVPLESITFKDQSFQGWHLEPGYYEFLAQGVIHMGPDEAGYVIVRSSLNRNGIFITSGLYDSGYRGVMAGALHVTQPAILGYGTRIGQFVLFKAEALNQYDGSYGLGKDEHLYKK